jgi:hypothetical protein
MSRLPSVRRSFRGGRLLALAGLLALGAGMAGCYYVVPAPPPGAIPAQGPPPAGWVYIPGQWVWNGAAYVWRPPYWAATPPYGSAPMPPPAPGPPPPPAGAPPPAPRP